MFRRVTIAASALVVLTALAWRLSILAESSALAQQPGQRQAGQQQSAASQPTQKQAAAQPTSQSTTPATQPAQGKLVVQLGGSAAGSKPTPEELKALARAAEEWVKNNPKGKTEASENPQVKDNDYAEVPLEEREAIGLPAPTWVAKHGKVQPAVYEAFESQRQVIQTNPMYEWQGDRPVGFQGLAYVDIYLRHHAKGSLGSKENQAAVREAEDRLLSSLSAAELSVYVAFKDAAGVVGYLNEAGLEKLIRDRDVIAVGLDDQPRPLETVVIRDSHEIRSQPRDGSEARSQISYYVYEELAKSEDGWVPVVVSLNKPPAGEISSGEDRDAIQRKLEDSVLSALTAREFRTRSRLVLSGVANRTALAKLDIHSDVFSVGLDCAFRVRHDPPPTQTDSHQ